MLIIEFFIVFVNIYLYICDGMEKEIINDYINGLNVKILGKKYHTSPKKVTKILLKNGIDVHDPSRSFGPRKKMPDGFWQIKENNELSASKFRNRREFSRGNSVAYKIALKNGWIKEYDEKYFSKDIKYYGFDEPIHVVYSYEFSEINYVYVGRTMDLKRRDCSHRSPSQNDSVYNFAKEHNLKIPEVKILSKNLVAKESQRLEDEFKNKYAQDGWNLINKAKTGENTGSLGSSQRKWTYESCRKAAESCKNREEFKNKFSRAHIVSRKNNWISVFFPNKSKKENGCFDTLEGCKEACRNFNSISQIRKEYPFLYHKILKNKWSEEIKKYINELR